MADKDERGYSPRTRKFGPKDTIIVSLDTMIYSDVPCAVCGGLIPYNRAMTSQRLYPDHDPEHCSDRCMKTKNMRIFRANGAARKAAKQRTSKKSTRAA